MGDYESRREDYKREQYEMDMEAKYGFVPGLTKCPQCGSEELSEVDYDYGGEYPNSEHRRGYECDNCGSEVSSAV